MEEILTFSFPELKGVKLLEGKHKVRFEVIWVQTKGCMKQRTVIHTVDSPVVELWCEQKKVMPKVEDEDMPKVEDKDMPKVEDEDMPKGGKEGTVMSGTVQAANEGQELEG